MSEIWNLNHILIFYLRRMSTTLSPLTYWLKAFLPRLFLYVFLLFPPYSLRAQNSTLQISAEFSVDSMQMTCPLSIYHVKFYISRIQILVPKLTSTSTYDDSQNISCDTVQILETPRLIVLSPQNNAVKFDLPFNFHRVQIFFGVDSFWQVSNSWEGDLDPLNGMYWDWQNGYIDYKVEGVSLCSGEIKHTVQYHLGGLQGGHSTRQFIDISGLQHHVHLTWRAADFFSDSLLKDHPIEMTPGFQAVQLSKRFKSAFSWW